MRASDPGFSVERFHYAPAGGDWAVLRLLAVLADEAAAPKDAGVTVTVTGAGEPGGVHPARACDIERRLLSARGRADQELLWRASFVLPLDLVRAPDAVFALIAADGMELALPTPGLRPITRHALAISGYRGGGDAPRRLRSARSIAALATAVAVTATSSPAVAFADVAGAATTPATSTTPTPVPGVATETAAATTPAPTASTAASTAPATTTATTTATTSATASAATAPAAATAGTATATATGGSDAAVSPTRLVDTTPSAGAPASGLAKRPPSRLTHLFAAPSRIGAAAATNRRATGCTSTRPHREAIAYAAGSPARLRCPAPANGAVVAGAGTRPGLPLGATLRIGPSAAAPVPPTAPGTATGPTPPTSTHGPTAARHHRTHRIAGHHPVTTGVPATHPAPEAAPVSPLSPAAPGFLAPQAWTGTVNPDPALTGAVENLSGLLADGNRPPSFLIPIYMAAGHRYDVPWEVLAAINAIESDYGRNLNTSTAGAVGWMQFEPSTWKRYGLAADGHSVANPWDPRDAIFSAARYLAAAGAGQDITGAIFAYNHAGWYVDEVLTRARAIADHAQYEHAALRRGTFSVQFATGLRRRPNVSYRSGVLSHYDRLIAAANMVSAANYPYVWGGGHEQPARFGPFDCSGSVSYVMQQAGYQVPTTVSGDIPVWKFPTGPGRVTIFYNPTHTFMRIGNRFFGTSGFARGSGGAGWFNVDKLPAGYLSQFHEVHVPGLGFNSFAPGALPPAPRRFSHRSTSTRPLAPTLVLSTLGSFPRVG